MFGSLRTASTRLTTCFAVVFPVNAEDSLNHLCTIMAGGISMIFVFFWNFLSKVKKVSQLPSIDNWFEYVSKPLLLNVCRSKTASLVEIVQTLYLRVLRRVKSWQGDSPFRGSSILKALRGFEDVPRRSFLRECQGYPLELLKQLGSSPYASSRIARSFISLSVDMLLGGDADQVSDLFHDPVLS